MCTFLRQKSYLPNSILQPEEMASDNAKHVSPGCSTTSQKYEDLPSQCFPIDSNHRCFSSNIYREEDRSHCSHVTEENNLIIEALYFIHAGSKTPRLKTMHLHSLYTNHKYSGTKCNVILRIINGLGTDLVLIICN